MSSSSNWYSKLYTFKCHQERAKPTSTFLCIGSTFLRRRSSAGPTMRPRIHIFTVLPGGSGRGRAEADLIIQFWRAVWVGGCKRTGWTDDRWRDVDVAIRGRVLRLLPCVIVGGPFLHSNATKQVWSGPFRADRGSQCLN